jgi:hypothetical protein
MATADNTGNQSIVITHAIHLWVIRFSVGLFPEHICIRVYLRYPRKTLNAESRTMDPPQMVRMESRCRF